MLTVGIFINGNPLVAKNCINQGEENEHGETKYKTDCGHIIWHKQSNGAIALAHMLLDMIKNEK